MLRHQSAIGLLAALVLAGCAATTPRELDDARAEYQRVMTNGRAGRDAPAELETGKEALARAEGAFEEYGDDPYTRDLAYVAHRKLRYSEVHAEMLRASRDRAQAEADLLTLATNAAERTSQQLNQTTERLTQTADQLEKEHLARIEAEKRFKDAMNRLAAIASIKEEARGTVITLPGGVLFESGKSTLLPGAMERLNQVADALLQDRDSVITIEGHTDAQGPDVQNQQLSDSRAAAVREHLVSRGIAADRIKSMGYGEQRPVADNNSAEGRANNRRVEIIVKRPDDAAEPAVK